MKHLTLEEIIDFVSLNDMEPETLALASRVTAHVLDCEACRKKVEAFQIVFDEFIRAGHAVDSPVKQDENRQRFSSDH